MTDYESLWQLTRGIAGVVLMIGPAFALILDVITFFQYTVLWALGILVIDYGMTEDEVKELVRDAVGEKVSELYTGNRSEEEVRLNVEVVDE